MIHFRIQFFMEDGSRDPWWQYFKSRTIASMDDINEVATQIKTDWNFLCSEYPFFHGNQEIGVLLTEIMEESNEQEFRAYVGRETEVNFRRALPSAGVAEARRNSGGRSRRRAVVAQA